MQIKQYDNVKIIIYYIFLQCFINVVSCFRPPEDSCLPLFSLPPPITLFPGLPPPCLPPLSNQPWPPMCTSTTDHVFCFLFHFYLIRLHLAPALHMYSYNGQPLRIMKYDYKISLVCPSQSPKEPSF